MDGFDMGSTEIPGMEDMPNMDEGIEVGRDNNWNLGFNASMPIVNAALWKSLSISAVDVELAIEQARSSNCYGQPGKERVLRRASCQRFIPRI